MLKKLFLCVFLLLTSCAVPQTPAGPAATDTPSRDTTVSATAEPAEATETAVTSLVSGNVCYPSEFIPEMTAYFRDVNSGITFHFLITEGQSSYEVELPVGTYEAFAWRPDQQLGGGYTAAVPCGFGDSCSDHSLLSFSTGAGETVTGIDLCDWILTDLPLPGIPGSPELTSVSNFSGLVFSVDDATWWIDPSGQIVQLVNRPDTHVLSVDALVYAENDDLWLLDLRSGASRNLTNTPERVEILWFGSAHPGGSILFTSYPLDMEIGPGVSGFLTRVNLDGSGYQILDDSEQANRFALSPDGARVAYGQSATGRIVDLESGLITEFVPADYGLENVNSVGSPAWTPDGGRLSWVVGYQSSEGQPFTFGLAVVDLATGAGSLLHPHDIVGMDGYPPPAAWRPDGSWLAYVAFDSDFSRNGIWLLSADGISEIYLGPSDRPIWSPDGRQLVYMGWSDDNAGLMVFDAISLVSEPLNLAANIVVPNAWLP